MTGDLPGPLVVACQFGAIAIVYGALRLVAVLVRVAFARRVASIRARARGPA